MAKNIVNQIRNDSAFACVHPRGFLVMETNKTT